MKTTLVQLNNSDRERFVRLCGPFFEHSPWIAERTWPKRPFASRAALHQAMCKVMYAASRDEQMALIRSHPDLVGQMAPEGALTRESKVEQAAAGLADLSAEEIERFDRYNAAYRERFGFPFVICAWENRKDAILAEFPRRLINTQDVEIATALDQIANIARLRLLDAIIED
jgi:OHCU decarboxylase